MTIRRTAGLAVVAVALCAGVLALDRAWLAAGWSTLVVRAATGGLDLKGTPRTAVAWPGGLVERIRDATLSKPGGTLRTSGFELDRSVLGSGQLDIRLDHPLVPDGATAWNGRAVTVELTRSGRLRLHADLLQTSTGAGHAQASGLEVRARPLATGGTLMTASFDGLVLPFAAPLAERSLAGGDVAATVVSTDTVPTLSITRATARWLGVTISAKGRLTLAGTRPVGALSVTIGPGWREALRRAAHDGAMTDGQSRAAIGLLALLGTGETVSNLPLAIADGRVTLEGLLLMRLSRDRPGAPPLKPR